MKFLINHIKQQYHIKDYKFGLIISVVAISVIGIMMVGSAKPDFMTKQIMGVILGFGAMVVVSLIDYKWIMNFYWILYVINLILLIAVKIPGLGHSANGAQRWINLGFMQLQPSDLTKILLIIFFARFFSDRELKISSPKVIIQSVALLIPSLILIVTQPNLSTTICIAALFCALIFLAGLNYKFVGTVLAITIPAVAIFLAVAVQPNQPFLHDYQQDRILAWLEPEKYADDESYQQLNSVMAIGSGQLSGKGLNNDDPSSLNNAHYIAEGHTDFIFAVMGEELGFIGCCMAILLLSWIVIECIIAAVRAKDFAGRLICCGVAAQIGFQSALNIAVATQLLPNTGQPLPFFSYGLTSLVSAYIPMGVVLNVPLQRNVERDDEIFADDFRG